MTVGNILNSTTAIILGIIVFLIGCIQPAKYEQAKENGYEVDATIVEVVEKEETDSEGTYTSMSYTVYADCHPDARSGFASSQWERQLELDFPDSLAAKIPDEELLAALKGVLENDPRPSYHKDPERIYGMDFGGYNVKFRVGDGILTVVDLSEI